MAVREGLTETFVTAQVALDGTAVLAEFVPGRPIEIVRVGYIWDAATVTAPETLVLEFNKRVTVGAATGELKIGSIPGTAGEAQGGGGYGNLSSTQAALRKLDADESVGIETTAGATAGDGRVFIEYVPLAFPPSEISLIGGLTSKTVTA